MELLLFIGAIWVTWALLARWWNGHERSGKRAKQSPTSNAPDERRQRKIARQASELEGRRETVLAALREGKLKPVQIAQVLEAASLYKFSPEEVAELHNALPQAKTHPEFVGAQPCRVCGKPSMPGEDLCYSHQAK